MCDPAELAAKAAGEAVEKVLESEPVNNLLAPITKELGLALGEIGSVFRFYNSLNLNNVFKRWSQQRQGKPINSEELQRVLPFLPDASLQSDGELQERWAALLESTVADSVVLPSFGHTLSQLTTEEARYVSTLFATVIRPNRLPYRHLVPEGGYFPFNLMMYVLGPELSEYSGEYRSRNNRLRIGPLTRAQHEAFANLDKLYLMIQDLQRLGIIDKTTELVQGTSWIETDSKEVKIPGEAHLSEHWYFTPYGKKFIAAVTPRKKPEPTPNY